jgi:hypothetical protein
MHRHLLTSLIGALMFALPATAQPTAIDLEITPSCDADTLVVCIPLSLPKKIAGLREVPVSVEVAGAKRPLVREMVGQLAAPGLLTEHIPPDGADLVRRDLYFQILSAKAGTVIKAKVEPKLSGLLGYGFGWKSKDGEYAELSLNYGRMPVLRYLHSPYDNSTQEKHDRTCKVSHCLYNFRATKSAKVEDLYAHPHTLLYAFDKVTLDDGRECDIWNGKPGDTHQAHTGFSATEVGRVVARQRVTIEWRGPKKEVFAKEEREITAYNFGPRGTMIDFVSRLITAGGVVKLRGDPNSAGLQFRAHDAVKESAKQTYFIRPDGKGALGETRTTDPKAKKEAAPLWEACSYLVDNKRYTAAVLAHPRNPARVHWSESDSGYLGCSFDWDLTEKKPLIVTYRIWLQNGEMTVERIDTLSKVFREPPKVSIKPQAQDADKP